MIKTKIPIMKITVEIKRRINNYNYKKELNKDFRIDIGEYQNKITKIFIKLSKELKYIQDLLFQYLKESGYIISNIYKIYDSVLKS